MPKVAEESHVPDVVCLVDDLTNAPDSLVERQARQISEETTERIRSILAAEESRAMRGAWIMMAREVASQAFVPVFAVRSLEEQLSEEGYDISPADQEFLLKSRQKLV